MSQPPLTIAVFQEHIHEGHDRTDTARDTPATLMGLMDPIGELDTTPHKATPPDRGHGDPPTDPAARQDLEEEFADVLAWLCTLASINGMDLHDAARKKTLTGSGPQGRK